MKWITCAVLAVIVSSGCAHEAGLVEGAGGRAAPSPAPMAQATTSATASDDVHGADALTTADVPTLLADAGERPFESLGAVAYSAAAISSWGKGRLDVFVRGTDLALWHRYLADEAWSSWERLGGRFESSPAAVSWGPNHIDVFVRSSRGTLQQLTYDDGAWGEWNDLGGAIAYGSNPAVASWGPGRLDVFARGTNDRLYQKSYETGWGEWQNLDVSLNLDPAAVSWGKGRIDVAARLPSGSWAIARSRTGAGARAGPTWAAS